MKNNDCDRRAFLQRIAARFVIWVPLLSMLGFRFNAYTHGITAGYKGWITLFGRCVGFVESTGKILWMW